MAKRRNPFLLLIGSVLLLASKSVADLQSPPILSFLDQHCIECHDDVTTKGGGLNLLELEFNPDDINNLAIWTKVRDRAKSGEMPPEKKRRPDREDLGAFVAVTATTLEEEWQTRYSEQGRVGGRRLNPTEYENTLRDLLAAPWLELKNMLPPDPEVHGFDNVAEAQEVSYIQLGRFLDAAEVAIDGAMQLRPPMKPENVRTWFTEEGRYLGKDWKERHAQGEMRPEWVPFLGQPNSAQAPRRIRNTSPKIAGWYRFRTRCRSFTFDKATGQMSAPQRGHVAWINTAAKRTLGKFDVPDGPDGGVVEFVAWQNQDELLEFFCATLDDRTVKDPNYRGEAIAVDWFEIEGPFADPDCKEEAWPPQSYRRLFGDLPTAPWTEASGLRLPEALNLPDVTANKRGLRETFQLPPEMMMVVSTNPHQDAERLLRDFMERAYRRPPEESEVQRCLKFARELIDDKACFQDAMRQAYKAALCSPDFLYFQEEPGQLDTYALASRLSYLCWRSMPDAQLIAAAESGALETTDGLKSELRRLLADGKAQRFFADFAGQWLELRHVHETSPDRFLFPEYFCDYHLVDSGVNEAVATFAEMVRANLPSRTAVDADFVMVNERLAELYDLEGVQGMEIRRVALPRGSPRGGFLTQSSVLKVTANGLTSSPVIRGAWVIERILGTPAAAPPPDAGAIEPDTQGAKSIRELLELHSRSESCAGCHASIDPPGFALENFDVMGAWRDHYRSLGEGTPLELQVANRTVRYKQGLPVDASGMTEDGQPFQDIFEYRELLLREERQLARNLTERLHTFATGAGISFADRPEIESILDATEPDGFPVRGLLERVVLSETFRSK